MEVGKGCALGGVLAEAAAAGALAVVAAGAAKKVVPTAAKPLTIETTSTAKGISLPKVSFQKKPGGTPGKS